MAQKIKKPSYLTVEEMREHPEWHEKPEDLGQGGSRYEGSTMPDFAFKYADKSEPILECGPLFGKFTKDMLEAGYKDTHSLDVFDAMHYVEKDKIKFGLVDFNKDKLPYPDNYFGAVVCWGLIEHLENAYHFAREVHRVLKPGGHFIFSMPNPMHIKSRWSFLRSGKLPRWSHKDNHTMIFANGMLEKSYFRYFELLERRFSKFNLNPKSNANYNWLPKSQLFGNYEAWATRKRDKIVDRGIDAPSVLLE